MMPNEVDIRIKVLLKLFKYFIIEKNIILLLCVRSNDLNNKTMAFCE